MINVTLRKKASLKGDRSILYLDFYPAIPGTNKKGEAIQTRREMLGLYVFNHPRNLFDRDHNIKVNEEATMKWLKRKNELNKPEIYNELELEQLKKKEIGEGSFTDFLKEYVKKNKRKTFKSLENHFLVFSKSKNLTYFDITEKFCNGFKEYLTTAKNIRHDIQISKNTANSYFSSFKIVLKSAWKAGHLPVFLNQNLGSIPTVETRRNYITLDELNNLAKKPCSDHVLKRAALFSALTGLRFSDILKLTWDEVEVTSEGPVLNFTQQKTGGIETNHISQQAVDLMGDRSQVKPFEGLRYGANKNILLKNWITSAGITKKITFHCFRHTFATLQLSAGTDIYTVSKMLGHRDLSTTQIYAKVIDKTKREAANRITIKL